MPGKLHDGGNAFGADDATTGHSSQKPGGHRCAAKTARLYRNRILSIQQARRKAVFFTRDRYQKIKQKDFIIISLLYAHDGALNHALEFHCWLGIDLLIRPCRVRRVVKTPVMPVHLARKRWTGLVRVAADGYYGLHRLLQKVVHVLRSMS